MVHKLNGYLSIIAAVLYMLAAFAATMVGLHLLATHGVWSVVLFAAMAAFIEARGILLEKVSRN